MLVVEEMSLSYYWQIFLHINLKLWLEDLVNLQRMTCREKLLSQEVTGDYQDEVDIVRAKYELDKRHKMVEVKSGHSMCREEVSKSIAHLINTTKNDGGMQVFPSVKLANSIIFAVHILSNFFSHIETPLYSYWNPNAL